MTERSYLLITPCRDEARFGRRTLDSVLAQSHPPARWIIVDDGSTDETPALLAEYARAHPVIEIVTRPDRGVRKVGGGVIDAFYDGLAHADLDAHAYVCKLDLDLELPPRYFERLVARMEDDPRIGTASGKPYFPAGDADARPPLPLVDTRGFVPELIGDENSVGMIKFYRTDCFREIGGFAREVMWDGIDGHRCRQLGWRAVSWDDPELRFLHLRPMGTSHRGIWTGRQRHGRGQWFMGTTPVYMAASAAFRMTRPPRVVGGVAMLWGYTKSMLQRRPRYGDDEFREFLRRWQWSSLVLGKRRATERLDAQQRATWEARHPELAGRAPPAARTSSRIGGTASVAAEGGR